MAADFNHAFDAPWEQAWNSADPTSNHDQWSALKAAGRHLGDVQGDGNCAPRALEQQIKANNLLMMQDPSLRAAHAVPANLPR
jgi:hypothetical protein